MSGVHHHLSGLGTEIVPVAQIGIFDRVRRPLRRILEALCQLQEILVDYLQSV